MSTPEPEKRPPPWKRFWLHILDLVSSFIPYIDAARKHGAFIQAEVREGATDMRKAWHVFLPILVIIGGVCFYGGCKIQKFYDRPVEKPQAVKDQWRPPELDKRWNRVLVNYLPSQQQYEITNLINAVRFEVNNVGNWGQFQGYHPFSSHVLENRLYLDLEIPTAAKPILIKNGEIIDLPQGWQWNGNSNVFEIVNAEAIPVFQEFFTNVNTVVINGAIRSGDKVFYQDINHQIQCQNFSSEMYQIGEYSEIKLAQYFTYPAKDNLGLILDK